VKRRAARLLGTTVSTIALLAGVAGMGAGAPGSPRLKAGPLLPLVASTHRGVAAAGIPAGPSAPGDPVIGASFNGQSDPNFTPPDANGAIGPSVFVEVINSDMAIFNRQGTKLSSATFNTITGDSGSLSDPIVLWDPDTQRFYYNVWNIDTQTMDWGFSRTANPTSTSAFCNYITGFGYATSEFPDYPKLGQTKGFLLIGVNHYPSLSSAHADRTDVLWIQKPQGSDPVTTCPANTFNKGKFTDLRNQDGTIAFTPVPAIQTDPSGTGFVVASSDIECPDICGTGTLITVFAVRANPSNPNTPQITRGHSIQVPGFQPPEDAPQPNPLFKIDTLDGRLTHAVSGVDPSLGKVAVWAAHSVKGGAGAQIRWYEIVPTPVKHPTVADSGVVTHASLWVYDAGISTDRTCNPTGCAHGNAMVLGFTTSSATSIPAVRMVSKVGTGPQSGMVLVANSPAPHSDFGCVQLGYCRWGDYGGATPDPAADPGGPVGKVWLTNQIAGPTAGSWNWEATP
jgi:hypothetical protein